MRVEKALSLVFLMAGIQLTILACDNAKTEAAKTIKAKATKYLITPGSKDDMSLITTLLTFELQNSSQLFQQNYKRTSFQQHKIALYNSWDFPDEADLIKKSDYKLYLRCLAAGCS